MEKDKEKGIKRQDSFAWGKKNTHHFRERHIKLNENRIDYPNNSIKTSKYTAYNFLVKNLMLQFSKLSNIYFLIIGCLSFITEISTSNGQPIIFIPLFFIVIVSAIKDIVEDLKRHRSDSEENNRKTAVFRNGAWEICKWRDLHVGNIVMVAEVKENEFFPADLMILRSSGKKGAAYIETKNLDGETNLKFKAANKDIAEELATDQQMGGAANDFKFEPPNVFLYNFVGSYHTLNHGEIPLGEQNFILRGCSLRNTHSVIGVVSYTGHHTKIMMNSIKAKAKSSKLEKNMNRQIIRVFIVQLSFCMFCAFFAAIWYEVKKSDLDYLWINTNKAQDNSFAYNFFVRFGNWILIFTNFVPISLLVTLEMVRLGQGLWMTNDNDMTSKEDNVKPTVQSSNLTEELGQVEYIFSDKTGTLTKNLMEFKNLSVKGKTYGNKKDMSDISHMPVVTNVDFRDSSLINDMKGGPMAADVKECLVQLAICHTIITEEKEGQLCYNASSPDELALVNFAKFVGSEYKGMDDDNNMTMSYMGQMLKFKLLYTLEFNSTRKRMSIIVRMPDNSVVLYCKGADSILFDRMDKNDPTIQETQTNLSKFAQIGLRTLVLAKRNIDSKYWEDWSKRYHQASVTLENRDENMQNLQEEIERGMKLVGATAIEDKLQDDVDTTIFKLKESGIKVWVLTGDKVETAINIGYSCKLLSDDLRQLQVVETTEEGVRASLESKMKEIEGVNPETSKLALIISGEALIIAAKCDLTDQVIKIAQCCNAVLACRVSPKQKQQIVSMVRKEKPHVTTLAIGDGANDVNMIIAAHVGVGIRGVEGQQAARASDFAIGEFKILRRLLYYHGREAYRRNSYLILYNFYKNMVVVMPQFWFGFYSGFSGSTIYDQILFQGFNIFYASVPIIVYAITDEEYPPHVLMDRAYLYVQGMKDKIFNAKRFWGWFCMGIAESCLIMFFSYYVLDYHIFEPGHGRSLGLLGAGMLAHSLAVWVVNFKIITLSNMFNFLNCFFIFGSIGVYILFFYVGSFISSLEAYGLFGPLHGNADFWFVTIEVTLITYFWTCAFERKRKLEEMEKNPRISPEDEEINKILATGKPLVIEPKPNVNSSISYGEKLVSPQKMTSKKEHHTGYAFSQVESHLDPALLKSEI